MLIMALFWFAVLALIIWALIGPRSSRATTPESPARGDQAMTVLRERFARGEITAEEYEKARQILEGR
jgi:putative membrane protein